MHDINDSKWQQINTIPIFNIMNVKGYNVIIENKIRTFLFSEDIAREAGLTRDSKSGHPESWMPDSKEYEIIRWSTFEKYLTEEFEKLKEINPSLAPLIQLELARNSYILYELALMILMRCNSKKAGQFRAVLSCFIVPQMQQYAYNYLQDQLLQERLKYEDSTKLQVYEAQPLEPIDYYKITDISKFTFSTEEMAKELGVSRWLLYKFLCKYGILQNDFNPTPRYQSVAVVKKLNTGYSEVYWTFEGFNTIITALQDIGVQLYKDNRELMQTMCK